MIEKLNLRVTSDRAGLPPGASFFLPRITIRFTKPFAGTAEGKSLGRVVQWLTVVIFVLIGGLVLFGASETLVAVVIGALTFALTFGAQNVIQNFVAGLLIAIDGRLQIGQWVEIGDRPGNWTAEVLDISLQMVKIRESGKGVPSSPTPTSSCTSFSTSQRAGTWRCRCR